MNDTFDDRDESPEETVRAWKEYEFEPTITVKVPRATWERVCEEAAPLIEPDEIVPYTPGHQPTAIEEELLNYFSPTYTWDLADEDGAD